MFIIETVALLTTHLPVMPKLALSATVRCCPIYLHGMNKANLNFKYYML